MSILNSFLALALLATTARAAPLSSRASSSLTPFDPSSLVQPAHFARAAYCDSAFVANLTCGAACAALGAVDVLLTGGDNKANPAFYVAFDRDNQQVVVAHQGTNTANFQSILDDLVLTRSPLNATLFPNVSEAVEVHDGFADAHARTADVIFSTVQKVLADNGVNKMLVVGHSLGASLSLLDAAMFKLRLGASIQMTTTLFGLPRTGNQEFADFVDQMFGDTLVHVTNNQDPVVQVPPSALGFRHPSREVHIQPGNATFLCAGQENENCSKGLSIVNGSLQDHKGPYFEVAIPMGGGSCDPFQSEKEIGFFERRHLSK